MTVSYKKAGPGGGAYYTDCMTPDGAARVDDYYTGSAKEPPGRWFVAAGPDGLRSTTLGIGDGQAFAGSEDTDRFATLVQGFHPETGAKLVQNAGSPNRIAIHDWTCSAPKGVSVIWSQAGDRIRRAIEEAQEAGARTALDTLSARSYSRRGKDGVIKVAAPLRGATFGHGSSREDDPQLHTHAVIFNGTERVDGTTGALETLELMRWQGAAASLYHAELAWCLRGLGFKIERQDNLFEVVGVPDEVCLAFSQRRQQIVAAVEQELLARGLDPDAAKASRGLLQKATTETRTAKNQLTREELIEIWNLRGRDLGFTVDEVQALMTAGPVQELTRDELLIEARKAVAELTETAAVFREPALLTRVAVYLVGRASPEQIQAAVQDIKGELLVARDEKGEEVMTTREMLIIEREMLAAADCRDGRHVLHGVHAPDGLTPEQLRAWLHVTTDANAVSVVEGTAGSGKTFTMNAIARAFEAQGYEVTGLAISWTAALNLKEAAQLKDGRAIGGWLQDVRKDRLQLTAKSVIVLDEAGMVGVREMHQVLRTAQAHGAKVILLGDTRQQKAVAAGDALRHIVQQNSSSRLDVIFRQGREEDRQAVSQFFAGQAKAALHIYQRRGAVHVTTGHEATLDKLVSDWQISRDAHAGETHLMLATDKKSVLMLNIAAHEARKAAGELGESVALRTMDCTQADQTVEFSVNDDVIFRVNDKRQGLFNRTAGRIEEIDGPILRVRTEAGLIEVATTDERWQRDDGLGLQHGYATTDYAAQGLTVDHAFVLDSLALHRASAGVAMSRHRKECRVYVDRQVRWEAKMRELPADQWHPIGEFSDDECLGRLAHAWSSDRAKVSTLDFEGWRRADALAGATVDVSAEQQIARDEHARQLAVSEIERIRRESKQPGLAPLPFQLQPAYALAEPAPVSREQAEAAVEQLREAGIHDAAARDAHKAGFLRVDQEGQLVICGRRPSDNAPVQVTRLADAEPPPALRHRFPAILPGDTARVDVVATGREALALRSLQLRERKPTSTVIVNPARTGEALRMPHTRELVDRAQHVERHDLRDSRLVEANREQGAAEAARSVEAARKQAEEKARRRQQARVR